MHVIYFSIPHQQTPQLSQPITLPKRPPPKFQDIDIMAPIVPGGRLSLLQVLLMLADMKLEHENFAWSAITNILQIFNAALPAGNPLPLSHKTMRDILESLTTGTELYACCINKCSISCRPLVLPHGKQSAADSQRQLDPQEPTPNCPICTEPYLNEKGSVCMIYRYITHINTYIYL